MTQDLMKTANSDQHASNGARDAHKGEAHERDAVERDAVERVAHVGGGDNRDVGARGNSGGARSKSLGARLVPALVRRLRLVATRVRFPQSRWGARCDIRRGLHLTTVPGARISFGRECVLDRDLTIECFGRLRVGNGVIFGHHCTLAARESVVIGDDCLIAEMVSIRDHDHCFDRLDVPIGAQGLTSSPVVIGRNVWLGAKVTVTRGVRIGDNAIVGANSVVTRDVPANAIAVGSPARVIRMRDDRKTDEQTPQNQTNSD